MTRGRREREETRGRGEEKRGKLYAIDRDLFNPLSLCSIVGHGETRKRGDERERRGEKRRQDGDKKERRTLCK